MTWTSSVSPSSAFTSTCVLHWPDSAFGRVRWCHCFFFLLFVFGHITIDHMHGFQSSKAWAHPSEHVAPMCVHQFLMCLWFLDSCLRVCNCEFLLGLEGIFKCTVCASHPSALFWSARFWRHQGWMLSVSPSFNSTTLDSIRDAKNYIWKTVKQCHLVIKSSEMETMYRFCRQHLCVDAILLWKHCAEACTYALTRD